jgi:hypothetical protein
MPIKKPFGTVNNMSMVVLIRLDKKYKKVAKGGINIYPKYWINEKFRFEKMIYLDLFERHVNEMSHTTSILKAYANKGQIYLKSQLFDSLLDEVPKLNPRGIFDNLTTYTAVRKSVNTMTKILSTHLKVVPIVKDKVKHIKTEKYRSNTEKENELLREIKSGKELDYGDLYEDIVEEPVRKEEYFDGCSNVSISVIDGAEDNRIEIENMNIGIDTLLDKLREIADSRMDELIPQDPEQMKVFIEDYSNKINTISQTYFRNLKTLSEINNGLRFQAKDFYEKYKEIKKNFTIERRDLKKRMLAVDSQIAANIEENSQIHTKLDDIRNEVYYFKNLIGAEDDSVYREEDYQVMLGLINNVKRQGVDVFEGLDEKEQEELSIVLQRYQRDLELIDNEVSKKLEVVINDLYLNKKKIKNISVAETDEPETFTFNERQVAIYLDGDVLRVREKGFETFEDWVVHYFGRTRPKKSVINFKVNGGVKFNQTSKNPPVKKGVSSAKTAVKGK